MTSGVSPGHRCADRSVSSSTTASCSPRRCSRTSRSAAPTRRLTRSSRRRARRVRTSSSNYCPRATRPSSVNVASPCQADSASGSPLPGHCWAILRSSCSTTPPARSTPRWSRPSTRHCVRSCTTARRCWSLTVAPLCTSRIASSSSTPAASWTTAPTRSCSSVVPCTVRSRRARTRLPPRFSLRRRARSPQRRARQREVSRQRRPQPGSRSRLPRSDLGSGGGEAAAGAAGERALPQRLSCSRRWRHSSPSAMSLRWTSNKRRRRAPLSRCGAFSAASAARSDSGWHSSCSTRSPRSLGLTSCVPASTTVSSRARARRLSWRPPSSWLSRSRTWWTRSRRRS